MTRLQLMTLLILVAGGALPARGAAGCDLLASPLVRATVVDRADAATGVHLALRIDHVYCGEESLQGKTFSAEAVRLGGLGALILPRIPETGNTGLWMVLRRGDILEANVVAMQASSETVRLPALGAAEHPAQPEQAATAWADQVERVSRLAAGARPPALVELTGAAEPVVVAWAVVALSDSPTPETRDLLFDLAKKPDLPLQAQVLLDRSLSRVDAERWLKSSRRGAMLQRWVSGSVGAADAARIAGRLQAAAGSGELSSTFLIDLVKTALANPRFAADVREPFVRLLGAAQSGASEREAYSLLIDQIRRADHPQLEVAAAQTIQRFFTITKERAGQLAELAAASRNPMAADILRSTSRRAETDRPRA